MLAAWRGDRDKTYQLRAALIPDATERGEWFGVEAAEWQRQQFTWARANTPTRSPQHKRAYDPNGLEFNVWVLPELIEAAARNGDLEWRQ